MKFFVAPLAALAFMVALGQAAPFEAKNVAATAKWVMHVDVDAVRDSHIVQKAFETCSFLKNSGAHFDKIKEQIGVDLRKDLHGITLYGPDADKKHAVAIVFSAVDEKLLLEKAEKASNHKVVKHGDIEIHSWTMKHGSKTETGAGAFYKSDILVFASDAKRVAAAIDVLDGKGGIKDVKSPLGGKAFKGSTVIMRATDIPSGTRCPVLKEVKSFRIAMGENNGKSFYSARALVKSDEAADQVKTIVEGFKAMGALRFSGDADMMKMVDGLKVTVRDNATISIHWSASVDDVWIAVEKMAKKANEHMKQFKDIHQKKDGKGKPTSAMTCPAGCVCPACKQCPGCTAKSKAGNQ